MDTAWVCLPSVPGVVTATQPPTVLFTFTFAYDLVVQGQHGDLPGLLAARQTQVGPGRMESSKSPMETSSAALLTVSVLIKTLVGEEQQWHADP